MHLRLHALHSPVPLPGIGRLGHPLCSDVNEVDATVTSHSADVHALYRPSIPPTARIERNRGSASDLLLTMHHERLTHPAPTIPSPLLYRLILFHGHRAYLILARSRILMSVSTTPINRHCSSGLIDPHSAVQSLGLPSYRLLYLPAPFYPTPTISTPRLASTFSSTLPSPLPVSYCAMDHDATVRPASPAPLPKHPSLSPLSYTISVYRRGRVPSQTGCTYTHINARGVHDVYVYSPPLPAARAHSWRSLYRPRLSAVLAGDPPFARRP
ncbi:hypothetical protein K466DRAFT_185094 [Polyporus arcularius HHB13444]|uniref:Uncharacterized protein n=1 Tax=Polyporus arcularius HHB13444 TaxID=1314778 RepID=A0A5C3PBC8_9APHY|nr:hypothetical protein K466DRAFT_185094 [Polyporus arcularius HHB13444]